MTIRLKIITPRQMLAEVDADSVSLPTLDGEIGVLPGHRPLYTALGRGVLSFRASGGEETFSVEGGFAEVRPDEVIVVTEMSEDERAEIPE